MEYKIIPHSEIATTRWSGGTTTQLAIWPENASYAGRNFLWRVSSATIEDEESEFTQLNDYMRILMVLDGALTLTHGPGHSVPLGRFDQTRFPGSAPTRSRGRATDFNLMMQVGQNGFVEALHIGRYDNTAITVQSESEIFYVYCGDITVALPNGKTVTVDEGNVLVVHRDGDDEVAEISFSGTSPENEAIVIRAGIFHQIS